MQNIILRQAVLPLDQLRQSYLPDL